MSTLLLEPEQKKVLDTEVSPLLAEARAMVVKNAEQRGGAAAFIKRLKEMKESIEERFHPTGNKEKAHKVYKDLLETEKAFYGPIDEAVSCANAAVKKFDTDEAIRIQKEADKAEADRLDKEERERAKLNNQADKAAARGDLNKAETLREQADNVAVAPTFTPPAASVKKLVTKAKVINLLQLCGAIVAGKVPFHVVEVRLPALNDWAKNQDPKTKIDGLEFYQESAGRV